MNRFRIGLVADTHIPEAGHDLPPEAYEALHGCDQILHCGDLHTIEVVERLDLIAPTVVSRGNGDTYEPRVRRPGVVEDRRVVDVYVTEVHGFHIGLTHDLAHLEDRGDAHVGPSLQRCFGRYVDIAVSGHTHVPMLRGLGDGTTLVNPGSPTMPFGYLGIIGTVGTLDIYQNGYVIRILNLRTGEVDLALEGPAPHQLERGTRPTGGR